MKSKLLNLLLIVFSLLGYLEWSGDSSSFLFQAEGEVLYKLFTDPVSALHPFTMLPLAGQIILLITLFQKQPNKILTYTGMAGLGLLLAFMLLVGILAANYKIILSTLPFLATAVFTVRHYRKTSS